MAVTDVNVVLSTATLAAGKGMIVKGNIDPTTAENKGIVWTTNNYAIASVVGSDETATIYANAIGGATITATTDDGAFTDTCVVTVAADVPVAFGDLRILTKDFALVEILDNEDIIDLTIIKELGGTVQIDFVLPYAQGANLTAGRYVECEGQRYYIEKLIPERKEDDLTLLRVGCVHIFFEAEKSRVARTVSRRGTLLSLLTELLTPYGIGITCRDSSNNLYNITRYIEYQLGDTLMTAIKKILQPFFCSYRVDNLTIEIIPIAGDAALGNIEFNYAQTNKSILKDEDHSDVITVLHAVGGIPESDDPDEEPIRYTATAPVGIRNLYRRQKHSTVNFGGMTNFAAMKMLADRYLAHKQHPHTTYRLSVAELKHMASLPSPEFDGRDFDIDIGLRVEVSDTDLDITYDTLVQRYTYKPLEPDNCSEVVLGDLKPYDIYFTEPVMPTPKDEEEEPEEPVFGTDWTLSVTTAWGAPTAIQFYLSTDPAVKYSRILPMTQTFADADIVILSAPDNLQAEHTTLAGWRGDGTNTGVEQRSVTMDGDKVIFADFELDNVQVNVVTRAFSDRQADDVQLNGEVTRCDKYTELVRGFFWGEPGTLTNELIAAPGTTGNFTAQLDRVIGTDSYAYQAFARVYDHELGITRTFTSNIIIYLNFSGFADHFVAISATGAPYNHVTITPYIGTREYADAAALTIEASVHAESIYSFEKWVINGGDELANPYAFPAGVDADYTIVAHFTGTAETLTITGDPSEVGGSVKIKPSWDFDIGSSNAWKEYVLPVAITIDAITALARPVAATGERFDSWSGHGTAGGATFSNGREFDMTLAQTAVIHWETEEEPEYLQGISSTSDPSPALGEEDWLWFKY